MIELIAGIYLLLLFAIWSTDSVLNIFTKCAHLALAVALFFDAALDFGFIFQL